MSPPWSIEEFETHGHTDDKLRGQEIKKSRHEDGKGICKKERTVLGGMGDIGAQE